MVPIAHGGDGGGSIRIPASCCGLVGLKPSRMRTPRGPDASEIWEACCGEFALTRTVRDAAVLLDAVAGQDVGAYYAPPPREPQFAREIEADPGRLRIAFSARGPAGVKAHRDCVAAVEEAARLCADLGHEVERAAPRLPRPLIEAMGEAFLGMLAIETACDLDEFSRQMGRGPADDELEPATWVLVEMGRGFSATDAVRFKRVLHRVARTMGPFFEQYDVYVSPTLGKPPVPIGEIDPRTRDVDGYFARMFEFMPFTALFNVAGSAAVSLPLSWNAAGLPIGVQFAVSMGRDAVLLRLAGQLERARPWADRRPPAIGPVA